MNQSILYINPNSEKNSSATPLIGLTELGAYLRKHGGYSPYYLDLGMNIEYKEKIWNYDTNIYGISVVAYYFEKAKEISTYIKKIKPDSIIIWGGYYPTSNPQECLEYEDVDYLILGEGEIPTLKLLNYLVKKEGKLEAIPGIAYRSNAAIKCNKKVYLDSLDEVPCPEIEMLDGLLEYQKIDKGSGSRIMTIMDSRGCPMGCNFCSPSKHWDYTYRSKSVNRFIEEVEYYRKHYTFGHLRIMGCYFTLEEKRALLISDYLGKTGLTWDMQTRPDSINEAMIKKFAQDGMTEIFFGIESGSIQMLSNMNKKIDLEKTLKSVHLCRKYGVKVEASFQLGMIGENYETFIESVCYAKKLMDVGLNSIKLFTSAPFPGTEYTKKVTELGYIHDLSPQNIDASKPICDTGYLTAAQVEELAEKFIQLIPIAKWGKHSIKGKERWEKENLSC